MKISHVSLAVTLLATGALGRDVPNNVRSLYDRVQSGKCTGGTVLQDGFYSKAGGSKSTSPFNLPQKPYHQHS